ncbi:Zinc uptake regulation protein ZUR [Candidatus Nitrotoga sp. BS]|nr:Zinc uptake regulation protein ZUR [Candidatus Nitrotoga sp. BS]
MNKADRMIQEIGERPTVVRSAVLDVLLNAGSALAHPEVLERLKSLGEFDRVTVYRVLEWLVIHGLTHKVAGTGRACRFQATHPDTTHRHAHFQCNACGKICCLTDVKPELTSLPKHFTIESIELNIKGVCDNCGRLVPS